MLLLLLSSSACPNVALARALASLPGPVFCRVSPTVPFRCRAASLPRCLRPWRPCAGSARYPWFFSLSTHLRRYEKGQGSVFFLIFSRGLFVATLLSFPVFCGPGGVGCGGRGQNCDPRSPDDYRRCDRHKHSQLLGGRKALQSTRRQGRGKSTYLSFVFYWHHTFAPKRSRSQGTELIEWSPWCQQIMLAPLLRNFETPLLL